MTAILNRSKLGFEIAVCTRCGGCGQYSYNQINGTTCFGCAGTGWKLTKRGHAAREFFEASAKKPLSKVQVGDLIQVESMSRRYFANVVSIKHDILVCRREIDGVWVDCFGSSVTTEHPKYGKSGITGGSNHLIRMGLSAAEKAEKLAAAMAYQDNLTLAGKPKATRKQAA